MFGKYLDLSQLRGPRGTVVCIFHKDRTPSLSVDLERGLFHCFGCGAQGGVRRFAELVGERPETRRWVGPIESELRQAWRRVIEDERARQARMADWGPLLRAMRWLCTMERLVASCRATAPDSESGWEVLADAAVVEQFVDAKTAEVEGLLAAGRVA